MELEGHSIFDMCECTKSFPKTRERLCVCESRSHSLLPQKDNVMTCSLGDVNCAEEKFVSEMQIVQRRSEWLAAVLEDSGDEALKKLIEQANSPSGPVDESTTAADGASKDLAAVARAGPCHEFAALTH
eukprot:4134825-Amphidinium_carterae.1